MTKRVQTEAAAQVRVEELSYEQARAELVEVVGRLEQGSASLEDSLALWERGEALAQRCQTWLDGARQRLQAATEQAAESAQAHQTTQKEHD